MVAAPPSLQAPCASLPSADSAAVVAFVVAAVSVAAEPAVAAASDVLGPAVAAAVSVAAAAVVAAEVFVWLPAAAAPVAVDGTAVLVAAAAVAV